MKGKTKEEGITLIALVITIIVLLILAGVSIITLTGQNGLLTKGNDALIAHSHSQVKEGVILQNAENITENKTEGKSTTILQFLQTSGIIGKTPEEEGKYIINTEKLLGNKMSLGNGSYEDGKFKDVYTFEEYTAEDGTGSIRNTKLATTGVLKIAAVESTKVNYKVMYYDEDSVSTEILDLGSVETIGDNVVTRGKLKIIVFETTYNSQLPGVKISIYTDEQCEDLYAGGIELGENGEYETELPPEGQYYIMVEEVPPGYNKPDKKLNFEVKGNDDAVWKIQLGTGTEIPSW